MEDFYNHIVKRIMEVGSKRSLGVPLWFDAVTLRQVIMEAGKEWSSETFDKLDKSGLSHLGYRR